MPTRLLAQPTISSFLPTSGPVGTLVTITGTNFSSVPNDNIVFFGAVRAAVSGANTNSITVIVPAGATWQPITVTVNNLTAYSDKPFVVTFPGGGNGFTPGSFVWVADSVTGQTPYDVAVGDLDGDGKPDVVTANFTGNTFSILKNTSTTGAVSLAGKIDIATGSGPYGIAIGDLDGDGKPDIAVTNYNDDNVSVFKNTSAGGTIDFTPVATYPTGNTPVHVVIHDLDGDGRADLATANYFDNSVSLLRNIGTGGVISFAAKTDFGVSLAPAYLAVGDLNQDGKPDIAVAYELAYGIGVMKNQSSSGSFLFSVGLTETTGQKPKGIAIGDLDGDNKPDLAISNSGYDANARKYTISVLRNTSAGGAVSFSTHIDYATAGSPQSIAMNDLDGDGKPDLAVSLFTGYVSFFKNNSSAGIISFSVAVNGPATDPFHISLCDMNVDGKPDIVTPSLVSSKVAVLRNKVNEPTVISFTPARAGTGETVTITGLNFTNATSVSFGGLPAASFTVVNATTITAVVATGASGDVSVTSGYGTGSLSGFQLAGPPVITSFSPADGVAGTNITITGSQFTGATAVSFGGVPAASFTVINDNTISAVVSHGASGAVSITTTYGTGTMSGFTHLAPAITSFIPVAAGAGDTVTISGSHFTDATAVDFGGTPAISFTVNSSTTIIAVVAGGSSGQVSVITPNGSASLPGFTFVSPAPPVITSYSPVSGSPGTVVTITGDHFDPVPDSNVVYFGSTRAAITTASVNSLTVIVPVSATYDPVSVLNKSTHLTGYSAQPFIVTFANGQISPQSFSDLIDLWAEVNTYPTDARTSDIDGDGKPDIVAGRSPNSTLIYRNTSTPGVISFAQPIELTGFNTGNLFIGDIDGDGKPDLAGATNTNYISVLRNTSTPGNISFIAAVTPGTGGDSQSIDMGDLDGDGKPELVVANYSSLSVSVLRNTSIPGNISFANKIDYATGGTSTGISIGDLDDDGKPDIVVTNGSTYATIAVFRNTSTTGNISFSPKVDYATGTNCDNVRIADLNGDNKKDVVVTYSHTLAIFKNTSIPGNISFDTRSDYSTSRFMTFFDIDDVDGDGLPDIAVANHTSNSGSIDIYKNTSSGYNLSFAVETRFGTGLNWSVSITDLDGDGKPDLATAIPDWYRIGIFRNQMGEPFITSFTPTIGAEGAVVTIKGFNLTDATSVSFGGIPAQSYTVDSATGITAIVANGAAGDVMVTTPYGTATRTGFTFAAPPTITGIAPASATPGTNITITGTNFVGVTKVSFGGVEAPWFYANSTTNLSAKVDEGGASGAVSVTTIAGTATLDGFTFVHPHPTILTFTPTAGIPGTTVTIQGSGFKDASAVEFGGVAANSFTVQSSKEITAVVGTAATGPVKVTTPYGTAAWGTFTIYLPPAIASFAPASGGAGTEVTIKGNNLKNYTSVTVGGVAVRSVINSSDTSLTVIIGTGASGQVTVTTNGGTASLDGFTYIPAPLITSFYPGSGATGDTIIITGTNFNNASAVSFSQVAATSFTVNSPTQISAVIGSGASGEVQVTTPGGTATLDGFTFIPAPLITSFNPGSGTKGDTIIITGANFNNASAVSFGQVAATSFIVKSPVQIAAVLGTGASGEVQVTTPGGTVSLDGFVYKMITAINSPSGNSRLLSVHPNPANEFIIIEYPASIRASKLKCVDISGRTIIVVELKKNTTKTVINIKHLSRGVYKIVWDNGKQQLTQTVLVQ